MDLTTSDRLMSFTSIHNVHAALRHGIHHRHGSRALAAMVLREKRIE
jgi:hypothetical protein